MWKKLASIILILTLFYLLTTTSVEAGSKQRHMWYGAGIALGALTMGALAYKLYTHPSKVVYFPPPPPPRPYYCPPPPSRPKYVPGHWETIREWVPGKWERVWVPGHYDQWGNWIAGHYEERQTPGYYIERRVWVEGYYRYH